MEYPTRQCAYCGSDFTPSRIDAKYCGAKCRQKAGFKNYYEKNKEKVDARNRAYYHKTKGKKESLWQRIFSKFQR